MAIPVNNPSKVTRKRTKLKKKQNNNLGSAPAKLEDEGGQGRASSDFKIQGMIRKARNSTKASAPKPVGRKTTDAGGASPKRKALGIVGPAAGKAPKPAAPVASKKAPRPKPKPNRVKKTVRSSETSGEGFDPGEFKTTAVKKSGAGRDKDLFETPTGVTSGRVKKATIKSDPTEGGKYAPTPKGSKILMGMTQKGYDEIMDDSSGEKAGGRPGRGKLKTQGMNKKGKRKAGFSGKGTGAALRGF